MSGDAPPPSGPKFLHFHAVFSKNWLHSRLAPPSPGNPGSVTDVVFACCDCPQTLTATLLQFFWFGNDSLLTKHLT